MLKAHVLKFYGTDQAVADAIGCDRSAVSHWDIVVPIKPAIQLERVSKRKLRVKIPLYYDQIAEEYEAKRIRR